MRDITNGSVLINDTEIPLNRGLFNFWLEIHFKQDSWIVLTNPDTTALEQDAFANQ